MKILDTLLVPGDFGPGELDPLLEVPGSPVQLWFSEPQHDVAQYLEDHTQLRVVRQPWPDRAWLAEPDTVASAVLQQLPRP